eukprot:403343857
MESSRQKQKYNQDEDQIKLPVILNRSQSNTQNSNFKQNGMIEPKNKYSILRQSAGQNVQTVDLLNKNNERYDRDQQRKSAINLLKPNQDQSPQIYDRKSSLKPPLMPIKNSLKQPNIIQSQQLHTIKEQNEAKLQSQLRKSIILNNDQQNAYENLERLPLNKSKHIINRNSSMVEQNQTSPGLKKQIYKRDTVTFESSPFYKQSSQKILIKERSKSTLNTNSSIQKYQNSNNTNQEKNDIVIKSNKLVVNTIHCRGDYSLIKGVINTNGWRETKQPGKGHIFWYGNRLSETDKALVRSRNVWYNRYVGGSFLSYKRTFSQLLSLAQRLYPKDFSEFIPKTYYFPEDFQAYQEKLLQNQENEDEITYIAKPSKGFGGHGITLIQKESDLLGINKEVIKDMICQEYIDNPLLIENKKFDMRLYVLLKNINPQIELYLCEEGMARFCTEDYEPPTSSNLKDLFSHLTNFTLNKDNENYVNNEDFEEEDNGTKRLVSNVLKILSKSPIKCDVDDLWSRIQQIVVKSFLVIMPYLKNQFNIEFSQNSTIPLDEVNKNVFQLYGIDILIDEDFNPWVLEINSNPSFNINIQKVEKIYDDSEGGDSNSSKIPKQYKFKNEVSEIDKYIKSMVITDAFKIVTGLEDQSESEQSEDSDRESLKGNSFELLYPSKAFKKFDILDDIRKLFESLTSQRDYSGLTCSQFLKLTQAEPERFLLQNLQKYDYELIFQQLLKDKTVANGGNINHQKTINLQKFQMALYQVMDKLYLNLYSQENTNKKSSPQKQPKQSNQKNSRKQWGIGEFREVMQVLKDHFIS